MILKDEIKDCMTEIKCVYNVRQRCKIFAKKNAKYKYLISHFSNNWLITLQHLALKKKKKKLTLSNHMQLKEEK